MVFCSWAEVTSGCVSASHLCFAVCPLKRIKKTRGDEKNHRFQDLSDMKTSIKDGYLLRYLKIYIYLRH